MYIKNVNSKTSLKKIVENSVYILVIFIALIVLYLGHDTTPSLEGAINAAGDGLKNLLYEGSKRGAAGIIIFLLLPVWLIILNIIKLVTRSKALRELKQPFNLKAVNLLENSISFNFFNPQYNFTCGYNDIQKLQVLIVTGYDNYYRLKKLCIKEIVLNFTTLNGKEFSIANTGGIFPLQYLKRIIECTKQISDFSYTYAGNCFSPNTDKKIKTHISAIRQGQYTAENLFTLTTVSIICFLLSIFVILLFRNNTIEELKNNQYFLLAIISIIALLPFITDIIIFNRSNPKQRKEACTVTVSKIIILLICFWPIISINYDRDIINYVVNIKSHLREGKSICGNLVRNYNGMTKEEIYKSRKAQMKRSIFNPPLYTPKEEVFGQIKSEKPWWGLNQRACSEFGNPNFDRTAGYSALSKYINNPNALIVVDYPFSLNSKQDNIGFCSTPFSRLMPSGFTYYKNKKLIVAKYKIYNKTLSAKINWQGKDIPYFLTLNGLNARDLGYDYVYAIDARNVKMMQKHNVSNTVYKFKDFIHVGSSCGVPGGCNNISPHQRELDFYITGFPARITFKLWKEKPSKRTKKADFYYTIIFESSSDPQDITKRKRTVRKR